MSGRSVLPPGSSSLRGERHWPEGSAVAAHVRAKADKPKVTSRGAHYISLRHAAGLSHFDDGSQPGALSTAFIRARLRRARKLRSLPERRNVTHAAPPGSGVRRSRPIDPKSATIA